MTADFRILLMLAAMISLTAMLGFTVAPIYEAGVRALGLEPEIQPSVCEENDPCHGDGGGDA
ncbi:MAG TPA: hypothetical protein VHX18_04775 [Rhizomicrobium sp.]|jgi:hypothetical protein|nr:hypothetical protein [Rhizomicrobium sp.]